MKKSLFAFVSLLLCATMALASSAVFAVGAENAQVDFEFSEETPFIKYEYEKGIRYFGATGDIYDSKSSYEVLTDLNEKQEAESSETTRNKSELAPVGNTSLPSSVDLSTDKYYPAVGNQGGLGSCNTFATTYYQFTYEINKQSDTEATPERTASPAFVYNVLNGAYEGGTTQEQNYEFLKQQGAPSIVTVPYSDQESLDWHAEEKIWNEAMDWRLDSFTKLQDIGLEESQITSPDDTDLQEIKSYLAKGHPIAYSTCVYSWVGDTIKAHPDAPENAKFEGEEIVKYRDGNEGGHGMTLVGYNDNIWVDQNGNNKVDNGEMGALKICNSWGDGYANDGFCWLAYDALNLLSSVEGGYSGYRVPIISGFSVITVKPYKQGSDVYMRFTMNTTDRTQMRVIFNAEHDGTKESGNFLFGSGYRGANNRYSFAGTTEPMDGTFCYPLDNTSSSMTAENFEDYNWSVTFTDFEKDDVKLFVKNVELVNELTGKVYKYDGGEFSVDGEDVTVTVKQCYTDNKTVYYIGYDEPTLNYSINGNQWQSVKMEKNEENIGGNYKYIFEDTADDIKLYFSDDKGNVDNNEGEMYTASQRINYFRTQNAREALEITGYEFENGTPDVNKRSWFLPEVNGGFEPFNFQYIIKNVETGEVKQYAFDYRYDKSHAFHSVGTYELTIEVMDQTGDIDSFTDVIKVEDVPFVFAEFTASSEYGENLFTGKNVNFCARTDFESVISRGPQKSLYDFVIKNSAGKTIYTETKRSDKFNMNDRVSYISLGWIPASKGDYTVTISSTDGNNQYAEKTIEFTVVDQIYGDANGDGEVNVKDATAIQKYLAGASLDFGFCTEMADCDLNEIVSVKDATCVRKYLAKMDNAKEAGKVVKYIPPETKPEETEPTATKTEPTIHEENIVTFTNSHRWSGNINCYYWSDSNLNMVSWPGKAMTLAGTNEYGESYYTFNVPDDATFVIFTNGSSQTVDIPYSGGEVKYYPLTETDAKGHYKVANW